MTILAHEQSGTGVPLVFIHAFPLDRSMWNVQSSALRKNFKVILIDLPGFGATPLENETSSMESMARSVLETLDALKISDKCIFTGLSMGGYVLFKILKLAPERIRGLVFVSTRAAADSAEGRAKRFKTIEAVETKGVEVLIEAMRPNLLGKTARETQKDLVSLVDDLIRRQQPKSVCAALRAMAERSDSTDLLATINVPALFISGTEDVIIPTAEMEKMAATTPKGSFEKLEGGHLINLEKPALFNDRFSTFLKRRLL